MKTDELVSIEDMTNWLQAQRTNSMNEGNLYEEIIVGIIKRLKEYEEVKGMLTNKSLAQVWKNIARLVDKYC